MKINKSILVGILLLTILFMGAVSAAEEYDVAATNVVADTGDYKLTSPVTDEIYAGGDVNSSVSSSVDVSSQEIAAVGNDVTSVENSKEKLGASNDEDVLGVDYDYVLTPQEYKNQGFGSQLTNGSYKFEGTFRADDGFWPFISFDEGCIVDGSEAEFVDMGIILSGNCQITGLTLTSTNYLEDNTFGKSPGAIVYVEGDDNILDGITVNYAPAADGDAYGIYVIEAENFQLLNSNITFTGSSLQDYYEYAMRMDTCDDVLIQANTITANLPILDVDYNKGNPGLATDLVLNTGIKEVKNLNIINNTFIANVVDRNGGYPTLDCVMMEYCEYVNVTNNKFRETDFITNEGETNYLNVLDMYYSSNVLVNGNDISVETTGGSENAGTSYPIQLTGPYENVIIDGNDLYANCGGPALGIFSQNYYGDTEITVQNNNIDVTGLPTDHSWGLVSGIELQDNVARVYNNTITTKSITGSYEDGMNIYGISYAQALNENHNYDIRDNTVETEGKYAIYLLKAQDTTITNNYLVSSIYEGDEAVYIQDASGDTVIENNHGAKKSNVVTRDNFYDFFDDEGGLLDTVEFDELIFKGEFENLVDFITIERALTITGDEATLNNIGFVIQGDNCTLNNLKFVADTNLGTLILVDGVYGATLSNLDISYDGGDEPAIAVNVEGDGAQILNNTIFFESHVVNDNDFALGLKLTGCTDILVDGNDITTKLPCVYCNNYDEDYYMMGSDKVNPVRIKECGNLVFTNNYIDSTTNDYSAEFPTIQSIQILGCRDSIIDHNNISMIDEMTPAGMDNYLYGINFGYNNNVTFSNNIFNMSTKGGKDAAGTAYAFQGVESEVNIIGNNITSISNGPNLGIYVASMYGGDSDLIIKDNFINVTGSASSTGTWALVSGIEIQNGDAKIYNNTVYTYNVMEYDENAYIYGISYAQWMYGDRSFDIQDNTVYTEGKYAISVIDASSLNAVKNTLYAHELNGDDSVDPGSCADVNIKDNLPEKITNIVTQDNFYHFFDEHGNLLDSVEFDELIFQGNFVDLVSYITIGRALNITGDGAVLNDIGFIIAGAGVTLDNMTLVANSNLGNLIDIAVENVVISNMDITYVVDEAASAINVYTGANNVQILNNTIYFESTVDKYAADEVTTAICVNSGVSLFEDEDPIEGLVIDGNNITAVIPAFLMDAYENEYYVMGLSAVNGVRINGAEDFEFTNNNLNVTTNWLYRTTPTFQALYVASSSGLIDGNNISMIDTFTPVGKDVYLYALELIHDDDLTISNNNFNLSTNGGIDEAGSAYAIIPIDSEFSVVDNNITTVSNGPNIGIYFPSDMGSPCDAVISGNFFNVTGLATAAHNTGLVSGIEIQTGNLEIKDNTIYTYNIGEYAEGNYIYGISYAQVGLTPEVEITDNTVITEGHYAISFLKVDDAVITDNYLVSTDLKGDDAVEIKEGSGNTVENNTPGSSPANISIEANPVWIGSNGTVSVNVPNATGTVTIEINGKSYTIELDNGAATKEISAEVLIAGENGITVTYEGPDYDKTTAIGALYVLDGVVTQDTYLLYFNQADNGKLFDYVPDGATLDFQGSIINPDQEITVQMNVNKPVNIISSTNDAYVDLNTTAGSLIGESPGNSFAITYGGSGSNVTGIRFHNTQLWFSNTHNVILDNISNVVEDQRVGSGVGATSIRDNSTNVTLKNSYFYTRNNGGSTTFTFSWASNCTIDNCTIKAEGNVGNLLYLNIYNVDGAPSGVPLNNYNVVSNNKIYGKEGSAISVGLMVEGKGNLIVNNTLYKSSISTSFGGANPSDNVYVGNTMTEGSGLTALANSIVYGNNVTGALSTGTNSVAYDNIVGGKMTVAAGATAYNNTVGNGLATGGTNAVIENNTITGAVTINKVGTTFVGNNVTGTVTVSANNNVIKGNNITTTGNYAVDLGSKTGNNVTDNYLIAALYKGDAAVKFTNANNVVENNTPVAPIDVVAETTWIGNDATVTVTVANTTGTVTVVVNGKEQTVELVDGVATVTVAGEDLVAGENDVAVTYNGPEYAPATVNDTIIVLDGVITNSTYKYYFDASGNLVSVVPNDVTLDFQGLFLGKFPVYINKAVNVVSTTGDALFDCGDSYAGNNINSFNIVAGGDNTNITGLKFINYCLYIKGASNVTVDDISIVANKRGVGSGTGFLSIHTGAYNTLVKNSYFENGGTGSSLLVLGKGGAYAVFDHNVFNITGSSGNILSANQFVGSGNNPEHVSYTNNVLYNNQPGSAFCYAMTVSGSGNLVENNTIYHNGSGILNQYGASSTGNVYRNNTLYGNTNFNPSANSIVENNKIYATTNIADNTTVSGNTFTTVAISGTDTKFVNNTVSDTVTVKGNGNSIVGNNITVVGDYAVDLGSTTGNNVTDNYLVSASYGGDAAVKFTNENNVVENNSPKGNLTADRFEDGLTINIGDKVLLNVTLTDDAGKVISGATVVFLLNDTEYTAVTDAEGKAYFDLSGIAVGDYLVNYRFDGNGNYSKCDLTVNDKLTVSKIPTEINVTSESISLEIDEEVNVNATLTPADAGILNYTSSNESVAIVDANGKVIAISEGNANITVSFAGDDKYAAADVTVTVTVSKVSTEISIENATVDMEVNDEVATGAALTPADAGNVTYTVSNSSVVKVEDGKIIALAEGSAVITVSFAGDDKYAAAENKTIGVTVTLKDVSVSVENATLELLVDENATIVAVTSPEGLNVTYLSDNSGVVSVDENGVVTALKEGTASIIVKVGGDGVYAENTTAVTVTVSKVPTEISVNPASLDLVVGNESSIVANLTPADAGIVTFTSSDESVVTVDANGNVVAVGEGSAVITVSFAGDDKYAAAENKTIGVTVTLKDASVSVENATLELLVDENATIVAVTSPEGLNVTYLSDNSGVVSVDENGVVTALKDGTASIIVKVGGDGVYAENTTAVTVTVSKVPTEISVNPASLDLVVGNESSIVANLTPADAGIVTFTSSDESVVTVDANGNVVAVGEGSAVITVSFAGDDKYAAAENVNVSVSVAPKPKENATIVIDAPSEATEGDNVTVTVTLPEDATGTVTIGNGVVPVVNGTASAVLTNIPAGNTTVPIAYSGDDKYNPIDTSITINVDEKPVPSKENLTISATADPITVGENATVVVTGFDDATGNVTVTVGEGIYTAEIVDGTATVVVPGLTENATAVVSYPGDDKYNNASTSVDIVVNPKEKENATVVIDAPSEATEGDNVTVTVTLPEDATGTVTIGNEVVPVVNGTASAVLTNIPAGNTTVPIAYSGDDKYNPIETNITINVDEKPVPPKENLTIGATADSITVGEDATVVVTGFEDATGNVTAKVGNRVYTAPIVDGTTKFIIPGLIENVTADITYAGDDKYNSASTTVDIVVNPKPKENATMDIDVPPVTEGQNTTVNVELPEDATGNVTAVVDGKTYTAPVKDGKATITIPELVAGKYTVPVTYSGDDKYNPLTEEVNITVDEDKSDIINAPDVTKYFSGPERFVVTVTDYQGKPLANKAVTITINGRSYDRTTDANGTASIALGLNSGVYNVTVTADNKTINSVVTILSTVNGTDIVKIFRNGTQYYATFRDGEGNYLKDGETVIFNINGVMYERKVSGDEGLARLNINLNAGEYVITAMNLVTGDRTANNITVLSRITENADLVKYYRNASQYTVKVLGDDGKAVGAGESVTFNINGVLYTRQTDANGIAKININLQAGDYTISAEYKGCVVSNNIKVLPILNATDISMKYRDGTQFKATLVDGQGKPYTGQSVTFNINGVFYNRVTDSTGTAKLNINLMAGQYIITSSYNGSSISNTITISA